MADKYTVTLWPPEHGAKPHIPIEVDPSQVEMMKQRGWRDKDPNPKPSIKITDERDKTEPMNTDPEKPSASQKKPLKKKASAEEKISER